MRILAFDTSTEFCSVALVDGDRCIERVAHAGQTHSELLLPMVRAILDEGGIEIDAVDGIAVGAGPGSFTGLRIGCGVAQGLAFAAGLPVVGISTLEAIAEAARLQNDATVRVIAALDARMHEVYIAAYEYDGSIWHAVSPPAVIKPDRVSVPEGTDWYGAGNAFAVYPELRARLADVVSKCDPSVLPTARAIAALALNAFAEGRGQAARDLAPIYVRHKVALTTAERNAGARL